MAEIGLNKDAIQKEVEPSKTVFLIDLDGVILNNDEKGGYKEKIGELVLSCGSVQRIVQDSFDKNGVQMGELQDSEQGRHFEKNRTALR